MDKCDEIIINIFSENTFKVFLTNIFNKHMNFIENNISNYKNRKMVDKSFEITTKIFKKYNEQMIYFNTKIKELEKSQYSDKNDVCYIKNSIISVNNIIINLINYTIDFCKLYSDVENFLKNIENIEKNIYDEYSKAEQRIQEKLSNDIDYMYKRGEIDYFEYLKYIKGYYDIDDDDDWYYD